MARVAPGADSPMFPEKVTLSATSPPALSSEPDPVRVMGPLTRSPAAVEPTEISLVKLPEACSVTVLPTVVAPV